MKISKLKNFPQKHSETENTKKTKSYVRNSQIKMFRKQATVKTENLSQNISKIRIKKYHVRRPQMKNVQQTNYCYNRKKLRLTY